MQKKIKSLFAGLSAIPLLFLTSCGSQTNIIAKWEYYCYQLPELNEKGEVISNSYKNYRVIDDSINNQSKILEFKDDNDKTGTSLSSDNHKTRLVKLYANVASKLNTYAKNMSVYATKKISDDLFFTTTKESNITNDDITVRSGFYFANSDQMSSGNSNQNIGFGITTTYFKISPVNTGNLTSDQLLNWYDDYNIPIDWNLTAKDLYKNPDATEDKDKKVDKTMIKFFELSNVKILFKFYKKNNSNSLIKSYFDTPTDFINSDNKNDYERLTKKFAHTYIKGNNKYSPKPLNEDFETDGYCINLTDMYLSLIYSLKYEEKKDSSRETDNNSKILSFRPASFSYMVPKVLFSNYLEKVDDKNNIFSNANEEKENISLDNFNQWISPKKEFSNKNDLISSLFSSDASMQLFNFISSRYNKPIVDEWLSKLNTQHSGDISVNSFVKNSEKIYEDFSSNISPQNNSGMMSYKDMYKLYLYDKEVDNKVKLIDAVSKSSSDNWKKLYTDDSELPGYEIYQK